MRYILSQMPIFLNLVFDIWFVREYSRDPNLNPISSYNLTFFSHFLSVFLIWPLVYLFILLQYFCVHFFSLFLSCWLFVFCCTTKKLHCALKKKQSNYLQSIKMMLNCILLIICITIQNEVNEEWREKNYETALNLVSFHSHSSVCVVNVVQLQFLLHLARIHFWYNFSLIGPL